jgi:aminopeptidase N
VAWADLTFDDVTAAALPALLPAITDPVLRATVWNTVRNGVHHATLDPSTAVGLIVAGIPGEEQDTAISVLASWVADDGQGARGSVHEKLLPVVADPAAARGDLHEAFRLRAASAPAGSEVQFAAAEGAIGTSSDADWLRGLLAGDLWDGIELDAGLRWKVLQRLTTLGAVDLDELDRALSEHNDAKTQIAHAWCHARLPDAGAKAWAWARFTGEAPASNYEVEAIGTGFWQAGQAALVGPYVARYFAELPGTTAVRAGWGLADGARFFYPITEVHQEVVDSTDALVADPQLNPSIRRVLVDAGDELRCRLRGRQRFSR